MPKFRKKPVIIEAIQFTGENFDEIKSFCPEAEQFYSPNFCPVTIGIKTLEGEMKAGEGDYIIKGVHNEFYPCKPDIFEKTYEPVND